jgi:Tfp pilus assembly protein PilF
METSSDGGRDGSPAWECAAADALIRDGDLEGAVMLLSSGAREFPGDPAYPRALAGALLARGDKRGARESLRALLRLTPDDARAWLTCATLSHEAGELQEALQEVHRALTVDPSSVDGWLECGVIFRHLGNLENAEACYRRALAHDPSSSRALFNLGNAARQKEDFGRARDLYEEALRLDRGNGDIWNNLGFALHQMDDLEGALSCYQKACLLSPDTAGVYINIGNLLKEQNALAGAASMYARALELNPLHPEAHHSLSLVLLARGEFAAGWKEYEWRLRCTDTGGRAGVRTFPRPLWDGSPLAGRRLLVYAEQGLGDTIQCARFLPPLRASGGRIIFACYPHLVGLCRSLDGIDEIVDLTSPALPGFDVYAALMSIPHLIGLTLESLPSRVPYLGTPTEPSPSCRELLRVAGFKAGLVWASNTQNRIAAMKSLRLRECLPLAGIDGVTWYSLQAGNAAAEAEECREAFPVVQIPASMETMDETAAVIKDLDLVITIDTSIAHLAGALGKPVWTLLPFAADWRWMADREDTPWYPTMRLFRQTIRGDWSGPVRRIGDELRRAVAAFPAGRTRRTP